MRWRLILPVSTKALTRIINCELSKRNRAVRGVGFHASTQWGEPHTTDFARTGSEERRLKSDETKYRLAGYGDPDRIRTDGLHRDRVAC